MSVPNETGVAREAVEQLEKGGHELYVTIQNQAEFWNVVTRPKHNNGYGIDHQQANYYLRLIEQAFSLVTESKNSYRLWRRLVVDYSVSGVQVHDARLAAVMLDNGIEGILTLNNQDFKRYEPEGIMAFHPTSIV